MIQEHRRRGEAVPVDWTRNERLSEHSDGLHSGHANARGGDTLPRQTVGLTSRVPTQRQRDLAGKEEYNGRASPLRLVRLRRTRSGPRTCPEISFREDPCSGSVYPPIFLAGCRRFIGRNSISGGVVSEFE